MDLIEGVDLNQKIEQARKQNNGLSEEEVKKIMNQMIEAVKYLHEN